ncbi:MAG: Holliday junction resolvase RuvX [Chloroflexi bacterium]|nr:Holliday junction resolvase RuvX [Chloroflexota bacterium]
MRLLGLDVGDRRIGVAVGDVVLSFARPVTVIQRVSLKRDLALIANLVQEYGIEAIVIGVPKHMKGTIGEQAEKALSFGEHLRQHLGIEVVFWDERLTTVAAEKMLIAAGVKRTERKKKIDAAAAALMLQSYLDYLNRITKQPD